jgi:hypothetical protein
MQATRGQKDRGSRELCQLGSAQHLNGLWRKARQHWTMAELPSLLTFERDRLTARRFLDLVTNLGRFEVAGWLAQDGPSAEHGVAASRGARQVILVRCTIYTFASLTSWTALRWWRCGSNAD